MDTSVSIDSLCKQCLAEFQRVFLSMYDWEKGGWGKRFGGTERRKKESRKSLENPITDE